MPRVCGRSAPESLNVAASIFMGQTEAPLTIARPSPRWTESETDDGDDVRHGAHLGRHHGGLHLFGIEAQHLLTR
jgi:CNT family concentrative nucleoside transporter